jgi:tRNA pseudouridine13 synthase
LRYTDPDVALSQSDEDKILHKEMLPSDEEMKEGEFAALQISLSLGTSAYATMALR